MTQTSAVTASDASSSDGGAVLPIMSANPSRPSTNAVSRLQLLTSKLDVAPNSTATASSFLSPPTTSYLSTLVEIFSPRWSKENLETVLRHFDGQMVNTVDSIMSHGDKSPRLFIEQLENIPKESNLKKVRFDSDEQHFAHDMTLEKEYRSSRSSATIQPSLRRRSTSETVPKKAKTILPQEFLRIPGYHYPVTLADDETLAMELQYELFDEEFESDPDSDLPRTYHGPRFMEVLSEIGDSAKKKLRVIAQKLNTKLLKPGLSRVNSKVEKGSKVDEGRETKDQREIQNLRHEVGSLQQQLQKYLIEENQRLKSEMSKRREEELDLMKAIVHGMNDRKRKRHDDDDDNDEWHDARTRMDEIKY